RVSRRCPLRHGVEEPRCGLHGMVYWPVFRRAIAVAFGGRHDPDADQPGRCAPDRARQRIRCGQGWADTRAPVLRLDLLGSGCEQDQVTRLRGAYSSFALVCSALVMGLLLGCNLPAPTTIDCPPLPDANQTLAQAWQAYQPDQPMSLSVTLRRRLFAFQALLLSAGVYDDQAPAAPSSVYDDYAPQFVRDLGMSRNPGLADALRNLDRKLNDVHQDPESKLDGNCGLILARRALREDPTNVSTDWILQTVTWGFAAYFQASIRQVLKEHAQTCSAQA